MSRRKLLHGALVLSLAVGCRLQPAQESETNSQQEALVQKNQELQTRLDRLTESHVAAVKLLTDITDNLAKMSQQEEAVRTLRGEFDESPVPRSTDLRKDIFKRLQDIQESLDQSNKKRQELERALQETPELSLYAKMVESLKTELAQRESTIAQLRTEVSQLQQHSIELEQEVQNRELKINDLQQEAQENRAKLAQRTANFYFVGDDRAFASGLRSGVFTRNWRGDYRLSESFVSAGQAPAGFVRVPPGLDEIPLGSSIQELRILSPHRDYHNLYYIGRSGERYVLKIIQPQAFWNLSHDLIIKVNR
jgi:hypothetical protein